MRKSRADAPPFTQNEMPLYMALGLLKASAGRSDKPPQPLVYVTAIERATLRTGAALAKSTCVLHDQLAHSAANASS